MLDRIKLWLRNLRDDIIVLYFAAHDARTPFACKIIALATAAYALSPIDLIPDFIPIIGWLDDLMIVPAGVWLALKLMPPELLQEMRSKAYHFSGQLPKSYTGALMVFVLWILLLVLAFIGTMDYLQAHG
jgi:uncharacterized membrane protein YkvA (DUF1232 family)